MTVDPSITDSLRAAQVRGELPTSLDTAGLRDLGADILARSVFCARGSNAIFLSDLKGILDRLTAGDIGEGQARTAIWESLKALGYTPEGGFPDSPPGEVPPAVAGSLQDLMSFRRRDLIVRTQLDLMTGAGLQTRGHTPDRLATFPAWELVRELPRKIPRDWPSRWTIAGGKTGPMIALKGDPVWGELGSYDNFDDALGVDHPPFAFESGMGWREVSADEVEQLGITGPHGETPDEWLASRPAVMSGVMPLPTPRLSLTGVDREIVQQFVASTHATPTPGRPGSVDFSDILARDLAASKAAYQLANPDYDPNYKGGGQ